MKKTSGIKPLHRQVQRGWAERLFAEQPFNQQIIVKVGELREG